MAAYCQSADLGDYLLEEYILKAEEFKPGIVDRTIGNVSGEIDDALRSRFVLPLATVPPTIKRICAVMSAWRMVGAITSMMAQETNDDNEWVALQTQYRQSVKDMEAIRDGKLKLGLPELGATPVSDSRVAVVTRPRQFGDDAWSKF